MAGCCAVAVVAVVSGVAASGQEVYGSAEQRVPAVAACQQAGTCCAAVQDAAEAAAGGIAALLVGPRALNGLSAQRLVQPPADGAVLRFGATGEVCPAVSCLLVVMLYCLHAVALAAVAAFAHAVGRLGAAVCDGVLLSVSKILLMVEAEQSWECDWG